jgi:phosphonoacetaldehyde hydrolase
MSVPDRARLVVFDWAGTTVDFGCFSPVDAFVRAFAAADVIVTVPEVRGPMGLGKRDHVRELLRMPVVGKRWRAAHGRDWTEADVDRVYAGFVPAQVAAAGDVRLVPGVLSAVEAVRAAGRAIGTTTGYFAEAAAVVRGAAASQGYAPEFNAVPDDVPAGRPAPWMIFRLMQQTGVFPPAAVVKVGDTVPDIEEARNAGAWSVVVLDSSSEVGLTAGEWAVMSLADRATAREAARRVLAGAHFAIDTIADLPGVLAEIDTRLARGERP